MKVLDIPFEDRLEPFLASNYDRFRSFSPTGQVPLLQDGARQDNGRAVWDSLGITLYLADRHEGVWPADDAAKAWAQCAVAEMHGGFSALRNDCTMNVGVRVKPKPMADALKRDVGRIAELWTQGLESFGGQFLGGARFTAVDAFFAPVAYRVRTYDLDVGPKGLAWVDQMLALPAMQEWEAAALAETWREIGHEEEMAACGNIIADYRSA